MNLRSSRSALLALGIGAAAAAGLAPVLSNAQTAPRPLPANPQPDRVTPPLNDDRGDARGYERRAERAADRLERRLEFLRSELRINASQEQAWTTFADTVRREAQLGRDEFADRREAFRDRREGRDERPGIVERLERRQQGLEEQSGYYDRLLSALRPLYAQLNDDQRRAADENLFSPGRDDRGRRGGQRRYSMDGGDYGRGVYRPFERSYGPFDPPYYRFNGPY